MILSEESFPASSTPVCIILWPDMYHPRLTVCHPLRFHDECKRPTPSRSRSHFVHFLLQIKMILDCGSLRSRQLLVYSCVRIVSPTFLESLVQRPEQLLGETKIILKYIDGQLIVQYLRWDRANLSSKGIILVEGILSFEMDAPCKRSICLKFAIDPSRIYWTRNNQRRRVLSYSQESIPGCLKLTFYKERFENKTKKKHHHKIHFRKTKKRLNVRTGLRSRPLCKGLFSNFSADDLKS